MKYLVFLAALCLSALYACKDHSLGPVDNGISLENMRNMKVGSYWIYSPPGDLVEPPTDSLVCVGYDNTITKDGNRSFVLVQFDEKKQALDTLYWSINDHQIWEYNRRFFFGLDTNCRCDHVPMVTWRLLYDTKSDNVQLYHQDVDFETLPSVVIGQNGKDTVISVTTKSHVDNGMQSNGMVTLTTDQSQPRLQADKMRSCRSGVDYIQSIVQPLGLRLKISNDSTAFVRDSAYCAMSPNIDGLYMMRRSRIVNLADVLSTIGMEEYLVRYKIITH